MIINFQSEQYFSLTQISQQYFTNQQRYEPANRTGGISCSSSTVKADGNQEWTTEQDAVWSRQKPYLHLLDSLHLKLQVFGLGMLVSHNTMLLHLCVIVCMIEVSSIVTE